MSAKRRKKSRNAGTVGIGVMVVLFLVIMSAQIARLNAKVNSLKEQEDALKEQVEQESERSTELDAYESYVNSSQYIEDMAKSKLGLVYDNEIVFKEDDNQ